MNLNYESLKNKVSDDYSVENLEQIVTFKIKNDYLKIYLTKNVIYNAELVSINGEKKQNIDYTKYPELRKILNESGFFKS
tara:strand:+ start:30822 stop:31061 length:240 start_codon:yes stop_codon:yes gene_type:complete